MATIDKKFADICKKILESGAEYENKRRGVKRLQIPSYTLRHDFKDGFPALTNKKLYWKGVVTELLQFLSGSCDITYMKDNGCNIWNMDVENFDKHGKKCMGLSYPHNWRNYGGIPLLKPIDRESFKYENPFIPPTENDVFETKSYGIFKIKKRLIDENGNKCVQIVFLNTGFTKIIRESRLKSDIYDPYAPSFLEVACHGIFERNEFNLKIKNIWHGMISRCYNKNNQNYKYYGDKGVKVSNRWKCFEYFLKDVQKLNNWKEKLNNWDDFNLDKDLLGDGFLYSFETCCWISKSENTSLSKQSYEYKIFNGKETISFINPANAIKQIGIKNQGNFSGMLRGERNSAEGWTLLSKNKIINGVDQIKNLVNDMKADIMGSRLIVSSWNPAELDQMSLPACHNYFQIIGVPLGYGRYGFELHWLQRSVDTFLGLPFNIASYALLAKILEKLTGYKALGIEGNLKCVHLYDNQYEASKLLLLRDINAHSNCELEIADFDNTKDIDTIFNELKISDFKLLGYTSDEEIKVDMIAPKS